MSKSKKLVEEIYTPLLSIIPKDESEKVDIPHKVFDPQTFELLQMNDLFKAINFTKTKTGNLTLRRSLTQPLTSAEVINAKQESLRELRRDKDLRQSLIQYLTTAAEIEDIFYKYFYGKYCTTTLGLDTGPNLYDVFKGARKFLMHLGDEIKSIEATTNYLEILIKNLREYRESDIFDFVKGPVYLTFKGLRTREQISIVTPRIKFKPTDLKPLRYILGLPIEWVPALGVMAVADMGRGFDDRNFVKPLRQLYLNSSHVVNAVESLGRIDELISLDEFANHVKFPMNLPTITDSENHYFIARNLRNPILVTQNPLYVPNDVEFNGQRLTFITGPNSGGKTSLCKTIGQSQILAQIGSYIPADEAEMSVADRIFYHAPMINILQDEEGRFGIELRRTRDIFYQITPKSLVILDELIEATTYEEKLRHSYDILDGFYTVGNNTILVTHNHELAEEFYREGRGQYLQVEFNGRTPTYKVIPGISKKSHSDLVAKRIGFTKEDIQRHLLKSGYIK